MSDDGGTGILAYHLYINEGVNGSPFGEITDYDGEALSYSIAAGDTVGSHQITVGNIYLIKCAARNTIGLSPYSSVLYVALARKPDTPAPLTFISALSTKTQIALQWQQGVSVDISVTGYRVYSDMGLPGNKFLIYDGDSITQIYQYTDKNLIPGVKYEYTLEVLNFNGPSDKSTGVSRSACIIP